MPPCPHTSYHKTINPPPASAIAASEAPASFFGRIRSWFEPSPTSLFSPAADIFMAGGAALILFIVIKLFIPLGAYTGGWALALYYAAFIVNYPHFAASYRLLYEDAGKDFFAFRARPWFALRLWWAGIIVPAAITAYFLYALWAQSATMMGYLVNALFFFVGWHYVKQIFGCVMVLSSAKKVYYSKLERWSLLVPLYTLWILSFVAGNLYGNFSHYYGVPYTAFAFPHALVYTLYGILGLGTSIMLGVFLRKFLKEKAIPPVSATTALLSIYLWYIPAFTNPVYFLIIPFFHSFQYLLVVFAYKRNQSIARTVPAAEFAQALRKRMTRWIAVLALLLPAVLIAYLTIRKPSFSLESLLVRTYGSFGLVVPSAWGWLCVAFVGTAALLLIAQRLSRRSASGHFVVFFLEIVVVGALLFSVIPVSLDLLASNGLLPGILGYDGAVFGTTLYLFFFTILVNIHHYFVDNVLWRRDNPHVREYLFYKPAEAQK